MNQFYLFNGFSKYIENELKQNKDGLKHMDDHTKQELQSTLKVINSNLDKKEKELMQVFDCNPEWPLCLYDFTYKNRNDKQYTMVSRRTLKDYVVENYFTKDGQVNR